MPFSIQNIFFLFYLLISLTSTQDISVFGNTIYDLWAPSSNFSAQAEPWNATLLTNPSRKYATCSSPALGGCGIIQNYGLYLRTYTNLPPHNYIFYSFDFYTRNGQWESRITWNLDNTPILPWYYVCLMTSLPSENSCNCAQYKASAVGSLAHTASTLTFNFSGFAGVGTTEQSFRNIKIILSNTTTSTATNQVIVNSSCKSYTRQNPCLNGQYQDPLNPGTCLNCSSKCSSCYGPSDSECYSCAVPGGFDGSQCISCASGCNICSDSSPTGCSLCDDSHFLDWKSHCVSTCPSPYITVYDGLVRKCQTPCQASDQFFLWDGTCDSTCAFPFVTRLDGNAKFCDFPCTNTEYLLWDNTCNSTCNSPYISTVQGGENFCNYPCANTADYYYLDESRCDSACAGDYQVLQTDFCVLNPRCASNEFYYWNQTCQSSCDSSLTPRTQGNAQFCDFPCANPTDYYYLDESRCDSTCAGDYQVVQTNFCALNPRCVSNEFYYWNQTCLSSCDSPLTPRTQGNAKFCDHPCPDPTYYYLPEEQICDLSCTSPYEIVQSIFCIDNTLKTQEATSDLLAIGTMHSVFKPFNTVLTSLVSLFDYSSPTSFNLFALLTLLEYIKYMKIQYPPKLQYLLDEQSFDFSFTDSLPDIRGTLRNKFSDHLLPENFEKYDLASSFVVNFWESLVFLIMIGLLILVLSIVNKIKFKSALIEKLKKRINLTIKWNFLFSSLTVLYSSMVLFTSLELRTLNFKTSNKFDIFSFLTCLFTNFGTVYMLFKMFYIIYKIRTTPDEIKNAAHKKEEYEVIFERFKANSFIQQAFMPIFTIRVIFFAMIIAYLFEHPFLQAVLMTFTGALMILFLVLSKPLVERLELLEYVLSEIAIFCVNICLLIFAILDGTEQDTPELRWKLGSAIIAFNITLTLLISVYNAIKTIIMIKEIYYRLKISSKKSKLTKVQPIMIQEKESNPLAAIQIDKSAQREFDEKNPLTKAKEQSNSALALHFDTTLQSQRQFDLNDDSTSNVNSFIFNRSPDKRISRIRRKYGSYSKIFPSTPNHSDSEAQSTTHLK